MDSSNPSVNSFAEPGVKGLDSRTGRGPDDRVAELNWIGVSWMTLLVAEFDCAQLSRVSSGNVQNTGRTIAGADINLCERKASRWIC
jgi:hypothetical protein